MSCLLLHGFGGSPAELRSMGMYLAEQGLSVRAPLLPGHGTGPEDLARTRWPDWAGVAESELVALQERYGRVHVVGFSMGGLLALYLRRRFPVASVVTLATPSALTDRYYPARISRPEVAGEAAGRGLLSTGAVCSLLQLIRLVRQDLSRVKVPILAIQGDRDRVIHPRSAAYILAHVSSTERKGHILSGRGHMITLEQGREGVFSLVADWVRSHEENP